MKVSLNWLKEHVDIDLSSEDLSHLLTMAGLEVEGVEAVGESLSDIGGRPNFENHAPPRCGSAAALSCGCRYG